MLEENQSEKQNKTNLHDEVEIRLNFDKCKCHALKKGQNSSYGNVRSATN